MRGLSFGIALAVCFMHAPSLAEGRSSSPRIDIARCTEVPRAPDLVRAEVIVTTGARALAVADLSCGAFRPKSRNVLFLNGVEEGGEVPPHSERTLHSVFPKDTAHSECRCLVAGAFRLAPPAPWTEAAVGTSESAAPVTFDTSPPKMGPFLRRERVVIPGTVVREGPSLRDSAVGTLPEAGHVRVYAVSKGWKEVRGLVDGWVPADATSPDLSAGGELRDALSELARHVRDENQVGLCTVPRRHFDALVFAWQPQHARASLHPAWESLDPAEQNLFRRYAGECFGVTELRVIGGGHLAGAPVPGAPATADF